MIAFINEEEETNRINENDYFIPILKHVQNMNQKKGGGGIKTPVKNLGFWLYTPFLGGIKIPA